MITNQTEICINLSHAKTNLKTAKSLLREIVNNNILVTDKINLRIIEDLKIVNKEINEYLSKLEN